METGDTVVKDGEPEVKEKKEAGSVDEKRRTRESLTGTRRFRLRWRTVLGPIWLAEYG